MYNLNKDTSNEAMAIPISMQHRSKAHKKQAYNIPMR